MSSTEEVLEEAAEWVVRLNDAGTTEAEFAEWQAWLGADPRHARAFQEIQDTWRRSASMTREEAVDEPLTRVPAHRRRAMRPAIFAMAASVAAVGVGLYLWLGRAEVIETTTGELRSLRLPDGSRVALGPETRFDIDYSPRQRELRMRGGEAYFEVAREAGRPFAVETPAGRVTAVGTAFTVHADENRLAVTVTEGAVRIDPSGRIVSAGHRLVREGGKTSVVPLGVSVQPVAWQQGRLEYQDEPLWVVVSDINRYSQVKVRLDDPSLRGLRYTGTVFPDTLDVWLASIEGVFPLKVESSGAERRLVPAER